MNALAFSCVAMYFRYFLLYLVEPVLLLRLGLGGLKTWPAPMAVLK